MIRSPIAIAVAAVALLLWPLFASHATTAAAVTPAPIRDDATIRAKTIAFEEGRLGRDASDQLTPRMLSDEYLQRFRERGDVGDVVRAEAMARRSLRVAPHGNTAARFALAAAQLTLHRFDEARATIRPDADTTSAAQALEASLDLEIGDLAAAERRLRLHRNDDDWAIVAARHAELTGDVPLALALMRGAAARADQTYGMPNERRAWFHVRLGELAFVSGDIDGALREEREALDRCSTDAQAYTDIARFAQAAGQWDSARSAAQRAVALIPSPENLGLLADAQLRSGNASEAAATRDEIDAIARLSDSLHLTDRLIAVYDADHGVHASEAYAIATRDLARRHDPFAEDAVAWTAARAGRWDVARVAARRAIAWNTAEPRLWFHAGFIADHDGDRQAAIDRYTHALTLNPQFQADFADAARHRVDILRSQNLVQSL